MLGKPLTFRVCEDHGGLGKLPQREPDPETFALERYPEQRRPVP